MRKRFNYNEFIHNTDDLVASGKPLPEELVDVVKAINVLKDYVELKLNKPRTLAEREASTPNPIALTDQLQALIDQDRSPTVKGQIRSRTAVLANILEENGIITAGQNLAHLDLHNVDCTNVDFSGSSLKNVNLKGAKIAAAIFDENTIISGSTKLGRIKDPEKAIGLWNCLRANRQKYSYKTENPEAEALFHRVRPRPAKRAMAQVGILVSAAVDETAQLAQPQATLVKPPIQDVSKTKSASDKTAFGKLRRERKKLKRNEAQKKTERGHGFLPVSSEMNRLPAGATPKLQPVVTEFDRDLDDLRQSTETRRKGELLIADTLAAGTVGGGITIDSTGIDDLLTEKPKKPKMTPTLEVDNRFGAALEIAAQATRDAVANLALEHPERRDLIEQTLHRALKTGIPRGHSNGRRQQSHVM